MQLTIFPLVQETTVGTDIITKTVWLRDTAFTLTSVPPRLRTVRNAFPPSTVILLLDDCGNRVPYLPLKGEKWAHAFILARRLQALVPRGIEGDDLPWRHIRSFPPGEKLVLRWQW